MDEPTRCSVCGEITAEPGTGGLCPRCLMRRMMSGELAGADPSEIVTQAEDPEDATQELPTAFSSRIDPAPADPNAAPGADTLDSGLAAAVTPIAPEDPHSFGDYEIQGILGRGGMGVVYLAVQRSLNRQVALKMIRRGIEFGESERRRFRNEAQAVARLDHPGIVPIHEVGEVDGRPYFSMKRIEGGSLQHRLTEFASNPRLAASMLAEIAEAVDHAHVRGILHRDLKPANILLDREVHPVVTDFGLARQIGGTDDQQTQHGFVVGTPAYMSPEQASGLPGVVTTASDVYSLGAILYTMLVGKAPFGGSSVLQTLRTVQNQPPVSPRSINPEIPRDLETICLKCLEKAPKQRYASAQALADDLRNWLDGRPIAARPASRAERLKMWCLRNPAVAGLSTALTLAVVAGSIGIVVNWLEVRHKNALLVEANRKVDRELRTTRAINGVLTEGILDYAYPMNRDLTVAEVLDRISPSIGVIYQDQPDLEAAVRRFVGDAYRAQARYDEADRHLTRALALIEQMESGDRSGYLDALHDLAALRLDQGRPDEAEPMADAAYQGRQWLFGLSHESTVHSANLLAAIRRRQGKTDQALSLLNTVAITTRARLGPFNPAVILTDSNRAGLLIDLRRYAEAGDLIRDVLARLRRLPTPPEPIIAQARNNLGGVYRKTGQLDEAEVEFQATFDWARAILDETHPLRLRYQGNLAETILARGRANDVVRLLEPTVRADQPNLAGLIPLKKSLAAAFMLRGDHDRAEPLLRQVAAWNRDNNRAALAESLRNHAEALAELHRWDEAVASETEAMELVKTGDDPAIQQCQAVLGWCLLELGKLDDAEQPLRRTLDADSANHSIKPWRLAIDRARLGSLIARKGDPESAEPLLIDGWKTIESDRDIPAPRRQEILARIIGFYENWPGHEGQAGPWKARARR